MNDSLSSEDQKEVDDIIDSMLKSVEAGASTSEAVKAGIAELESTITATDAGLVIEVPELEFTDLGEFCIDCRDPVDERTKKFASRRPEVREGGEGEKGLKGFLCEDCQPFEGTMMEPLVQGLVERRWDEGQVRERMRAIGVEELYEKVAGPTLDLLETLLRLER